MAGGPYNIPRNTKGESRFFTFFSVRALITTGIFGGLAFMLFYPLSKVMGNPMIGIVITVIIGAIGFAISSFKIPSSNNFELTRKAGGEYIDKIIVRYFKFKLKKNKIYTFFAEEKKDE